MKILVDCALAAAAAAAAVAAEEGEVPPDEMDDDDPGLPLVLNPDGKLPEWLMPPVPAGALPDAVWCGWSRCPDVPAPGVKLVGSGATGPEKS